MSTDDIALSPEPIATPLSMRDLATVLVKHYGLHEGCYDLMIEFQIGMGAVGPNADALNPGAMIQSTQVKEIMCV